MNQIQGSKDGIPSQGNWHTTFKTTDLHNLSSLSLIPSATFFRFSCKTRVVSENPIGRGRSLVYNIPSIWNSLQGFLEEFKYNSAMPNFYTRAGDDGTTGLLGDQRVSKNDPRMEAIGTLDEANAVFGIARAFCQDPTIGAILITIQRDLYLLMAEIAATPKNAARFRKVDDRKIRWLEEQVEQFGNQVEMPKDFIVPGDSKTGSILDLARTIVRRAERRVSPLIQSGELENPALLQYLNRLSSLVFILEVWETLRTGDQAISLAKDTQP